MAGPKEQPLPPDVMGRDDAAEVLRAFVVDGGLSIAFQRAFGDSPHAYLLTRRLERAAALLRTTDRSVADICLAVGLTSVG